MTDKNTAETVEAPPNDLAAIFSDAYDIGYLDATFGETMFDEVAALIERVRAEERRRIAREIDAFLDKEYAPPIWRRAVGIADPTYCVECPACKGSRDGCEKCYITDAPIGGQVDKP